MSATRKDVANHAQVSESTAGMILAGRGQRYSVHTREKVLEAAKKLNYRPNPAGRGLRMNRSFLVGVLFNAANTVHAAEFLRGVQGGLITAEVAPVVFSHASQADEAKFLQSCLDRRVDGIIANAAVDVDGKADRARYQAVTDAELPLVEVFGHFLLGVPAVNVDNVSAGRSAVRHLLQLGHRRIAFLVHEGYDLAWRSGDDTHFDAGERYRGYEQAMRAANLEPLVVTHCEPRGDHTPEQFVAGGRSSLTALLEHPARPTAVVCYNDFQAIGLVRAARQVKLVLPGPLSVVGFGDSDFSQIIDPPLTTLRLPAFDIGCEAARMVLELLEERGVKDVTVPCEMIPRESTAAVKEE
jgi:DNA-binding LacI/PurR family transcriptional regulator